MTIYYNYLGQAMATSDTNGAFAHGDSSGNETLTAPDGPSTLSAGGGNYDTLIASNGDNIFDVNNNTDVVQVPSGLTGIKTIVAFAGGYTLPTGVQNLTFYGAGNWGAGNTGDNLIIMGGNDHATLDGGGGNDVLVGGDGENDFQFEVGLTSQSHDVFYGFHAQQDTVRITGSNFTSFAQILGAMTQVTGPDGQTDTVLTIDANDSITFRDTTISQFQASDFLMPLNTAQLGALTFSDTFSSLQLYNSATGTGNWQTTFGSDPTKVDDYSITSNQELELYTSPGFIGQDGHSLAAYNPFSITGNGLTITAGVIAPDDAQYAYGRAFYSGLLTTRGVFMQQYGYFDMRAELPTALGSWPAFWLSQDPYTPGNEADILEHLAMYPNINMTRSDDAGTVLSHTTFMPNPSGFHDYGMLWTPTTTTFYIDSLAVLQVATPTSWDQPMYMLLNLALGGWGGPVSAGQLPDQMNVQYVKVYGLATSPVVVSEGEATYTAAAGVDTITLIGAISQTITANNDGDAIVSNGNGNTLIGGTGNDTFTLGGGGDHATGGGGTDTFVVNAVPTTGSVITDFSSSDQLNLSGLLNSLNYTGSDAIADGVIAFSADGHGDTQVLADVNGNWTVVTTLDGVAASSLGMSGGIVSEGGSGNSSTVSTSAASYTASAGVTNIILTGSHQTITGNNAGDAFHSNNTGNHLIGGSAGDVFDLGGGGDVATGGGGVDAFVINAAPTTASTITDFSTSDRLNLSGLLSSLNYSGSNPVADGVIKFADDGSGGTQVSAKVNGSWVLVTTLDGVSSSSAFSITSGVATELASAALDVTSVSTPATVTGGQAITTGQNNLVTFTPTAGGTFINNGQISLTGSGSSVFEIATQQNGASDPTAVFQNNGLLSVSAALATTTLYVTLNNTGSVIVTGANVAGAQADVTNTGTITVTGSTQAEGVEDKNTGGLVKNLAGGVINVSTAGTGAWGVQMVNGGEVDNVGSIIVSGPASPPNGSLAPVGVTVWGASNQGHNAAYSVVNNSGAITVNSPEGVGVNYAPTLAGASAQVVPAGQYDLINSGTITAQTAIAFSPAGIAAAIDNSGTLNGQVVLTGLGDRLLNTGTINGQVLLNNGAGTSGESNAITNTGAIHGAVHLSANGTDLYDGRGGTQTGGIFLGGGHDTVYLGDDGETVHAGAGSATIIGGAGNDTIIGGSGADIIDGRGGNDVLTAGTGADTFVFDLNAGADIISGFKIASDVIDVSAFSQFTDLADVLGASTQVGANTVIHLSSGGSVTLNSVSMASLTASDFAFSPTLPSGTGDNGGGTSSGSGGVSGGGGGLNNTVPAVAADLNGDGHGDLFWQNTVNGLTSAWELNGTTASGVSLPNASGWQVDDTGNFSGGAYSGDMLLRNTTTGMVDIWSDTNGAMSGHDVASATLDWQIMGTADFNGDGKSDILWRNEQNGYVSVWQMNGSTVSTTYNPGVVGLQWHVIGAGDYVGDGKAEVLWRDSGTGEVNLWTIDGPGAGQTHGQTVATLGLEWQAVGQGDFNGDGRQDVLWHDNVTGQVVIWEMNGAQVLASQAIANLGAQWKVVDVVDANGDGKADIVWRDSNTGQTVLWDMNGFNVLSTHVLGTVDNTWQTINHHFDWI